MNLALYAVIFLVSLSACALPHPAELPGSRTITLDDAVYSEEKMGELNSWLCSDLFDDSEQVLVEIGTFARAELGDAGFIIYDGGDSGNVTSYERRGINHRWDWGPNGNEFAFIVKPDGTGLFYDFTEADGESVMANQVFACRRP